MTYTDPLTFTSYFIQVKCLKYWPNLGKKKIFGNITVKLHKEDVFAHFTVREFRICKENCVSRTVKQYHYTSWPDKGVPSDIASLVEFRNKVNKSSSKRSGPMIVHCSAGIGRTGTYLALDYLIQQAQAENSVDIFSCVSQMRQERVNMVQTVIQYILLHDALTVWYIADDTTTSITNYPQIYNQLLQQDKHNNTSQLQHKYQLMNEISCKIDKDGYSEALKPENVNKNRDQRVLAANSKRLYLSSSGDSTDYINAVYMPSYKKKKGYVLTQSPMSTTVNDLWKMIMSCESTVIIDMEPRAKSKVSKSSQIRIKRKYHPGPDLLDSCHHFLLSFSHNRFHLEDVKRIVKIYQCRYWDTDTKHPDSSIPIFTLLDEIYQWSNIDNLGPLVVHCLNGANKSGLLCVLAAILERLTIEQDVNIIQTILQLRISRPEIINSFEQFQFCFEAIAEYLDNFSNYVNSR
ncbi:hypothetical protein LOTGIDRAFT_127558 [Lottia gigantea]|uniref:Protein-tyrosine-phosphatase n=1 Tax=Lottia gigantea TaxID=225164 RepID=V3Z9G1_LOTGI|nr:hypothetical protein LOTGIDRAFT_127558 [Lottia gigantea]ESO87553.1 hypothetical protein LOTGIDRAFT_127558 [Lottia gigantea]